MNKEQTLWLGDLEKWIDEKMIYLLMGSNNLILFINLVNDNNNELNYAFIEFICEGIATKIYKKYNNQINKLTKRLFRISWSYDKEKIASEEEKINLFLIKRRRNLYNSNFYPNIPNFKQIIEENKRELVNSKQETPFSFYVGDLDLLTNEQQLFEHFSQIYLGCISAKLIMGNNGFNKGYGFVFFNSEEEAVKAKYDMKGSVLNGKIIKTGKSKTKVQNNTLENYINNSNPLSLKFIKQEYNR